MVGGRELGLPTIGDGYGRGGIGGGGGVFHLIPEHSHTVHHEQTHYGYVSDRGEAPLGASVPEMVETVELIPGGDAGGGKGGGNGENVGVGGCIQARKLRRRY